MIPAAVKDFIATLSAGDSIDSVYCQQDLAEIAEFIRHEFSNSENLQQKQANTLIEDIANAIAMITKPYLERESKVWICIVKQTMYVYDSEGICISFVKPMQIAQRLAQNLPLSAIDGVHAGTSIPEVVKDFINPKIMSDRPIYQANPYTAIRQSDVGVKELIGQLWQTDESDTILVVGSAFLWNLIICNGNRPIPIDEETTEEYLLSKKTDNWLNTQTYRGDDIYRGNQLPPLEIRHKIQQGHTFSIQVAGAIRSALYRLSKIQPIIIEPHSYSGFDHKFLNKYLNHATTHQDWLAMAKQENALRPLISVLDVQKPDHEGYWTTTPQEAERFYQAFLQVLQQYKDKLPAIANIPQFQNDVYGYGGGILTRLKQLMQWASFYADADQDLLSNFYQRSIITVEINRLLVQRSEFEDVSSIKKDVYNQRCEIVGNALSEGIKAIVPLILKREN